MIVIFGFLFQIPDAFIINIGFNIKVMLKLNLNVNGRIYVSETYYKIDLVHFTISTGQCA
jgi:hypothetical protein